MIQFNNFKKHHLNISKEIQVAIDRVLSSGWYILGKELESFEKEFAEYIGTKYSVGVASGTEALTLSLLAYGIENGDEVITTNMTAFPTIVGIMQAGAIPVVVDIDINTGLIDITKIEDKITEKSKAIIPVHLYGQSCEMDIIMDIAKRNNLIVIEDCAQSVGAKYNNKNTGTIGDISAFSFYPTKNLGAYGDAGAVLTNDSSIYKKLLKLRNYGQDIRYYHSDYGINSRMDEIQAAVLRVKLTKLKEWNKKRTELADYYRKNLINVNVLEEKPNNEHANHLFILKTKKRDELIKFLLENGVQTLIHYPVPINEQQAFKWQKKETFKNTRKFASEVLSLPIYPELKKEEISKIVELINEFFK